MSTFAQLKENVRLELGLASSGDDITLLERRLNQAVREVLVKLELYVIPATISLSANDNEYELKDVLTADPLAILKLVNSDSVPMDRVSVEEIHELRRATPASGGNVYRYAVSGTNLLMIYPTPSASGSVTVYYVPTPTEMSADGHDPSDVTYGNIPVQFHPLLEDFAAWKMARRVKHEASSYGQLYEQAFDKGIARAAKAKSKMGGRKLARARLIPRRYVPRDPSST